MTYHEIISKVSKDTGLPKTLVDRAYKSYWKVVREHISSLPLKEDLTDEEFLQLQPNVNIPSIGKLYVTLERYRRIKDRHKRITEKRKEDATHNPDKTDVHQSVGDRRQV